MNLFNLKLMEFISPVLRMTNLSHLKFTEKQKKVKIFLGQWIIAKVNFLLCFINHFQLMKNENKIEQDFFPKLFN